MKLSSISSLASLVAFASASLHSEAVTVVCTDADPVTITQTQTVTVTAPCTINPPKTQIISTSTPASAPPKITTGGGSVTSIDYSGSKTSVWVYPTGDCGHDATVSVWVDNVVIEVIVININVTIINGAPTTIYSTKTDTPHWTPTPPPTTSTSSSTASHTPTIHTVIVGVDGTLAYGANQVNASIGDIIRFDFNSTNHTVTQSDFATPCSPKAGGFNTGFGQFNPSNHTGVIFKDFVVDVSTPLWFYCAQTVKVSHCHKGMVLGVNPAGKFPAFLSAALGNGTATSTATGTGGVAFSTGKTGAFSTGKSGAISTGVSKAFSTGSVAIPTFTGVSASGTGAVIPPKPTTTGLHFRGRSEGKQWFA